jgi:hypothetical protein
VKGYRVLLYEPVECIEMWKELYCLGAMVALYWMNVAFVVVGEENGS